MVFDKSFSLDQFGSGHAMGDRLEPIILLKFPIIILSSNVPYYAQIMLYFSAI